MSRDKLNDLYFDWLYHKVIRGRKAYHTLLAYLHSVPFEYSIPMDGNRADDGTDLRYRFCYEKNLDDAMVAAYLDDRPCTVLEMMVALAIRQEQIMDDPEIGNRTDVWFMEMIESLGLEHMKNGHFDELFTEYVIQTFMNREYSPIGEGGLYTVDCGHDMRDEEIWYQMSLYLTHTQDIFKEG